MEDLRSRAAALLEGPCCITRQEGRPNAVELIRRYVDGESWDDEELRAQLPVCLRIIQTIATGPTWPPALGGDAQLFYQRAAKILREIRAEVTR
jgi:hypothetical protein